MQKKTYAHWCITHDTGASCITCGMILFKSLSKNGLSRPHLITLLNFQIRRFSVFKLLQHLRGA